MSRTLPAAVSSLSTLATDTTRVDAEVLEVFASGLYLGLDAPDVPHRHGRILPIMGPRALRLPFGACVPELSPEHLVGIRPGMRARVSVSHQGRSAEAQLRTVTIDGLRIAAVRRFEPCRIRPRPLSDRPAASATRMSRQRALDEFATGLEPGIADLPDLVSDLVTALLDVPVPFAGPARLTVPARPTDTITCAVRSLLGRGPGSTPTGDDALCGIALALRLLGRTAELELLAIALDDLDPARRTTALSAELLRAGMAGYCLPEIAEAIDAVRNALEPPVLAPIPPAPAPLPPTAPAPPSRPARPSPAEVTRRLTAIGHSSGHDLFTGLLTTTDRVCGF